MFDLPAAKARLGIEGDEQDAQVTAALNVALAIAENYCDRRFVFLREVARFPLLDWPELLVRRYPIVRVYAVRVPPEGRALDPGSLVVHHEFGQVFLPGCGWVVAGAPQGGVIELDYEGGFKVLPADLEQALWLVFDQVWAANPGMGGDSSTVGAGGVRQFAIDGMNLSLDTSASAEARSQADGSVGAWGLIPLQAATLLQFYRAETVLGAA